jgi:plastocyanin
MRRFVHKKYFSRRGACYYGEVHNLSNRQLILCAIGIVVVGILLVFFGALPVTERQTSNNPISPLGIRVPPPRPAPTSSDTIAAQNGDTFQLVVSYVNSGFEPKSATIQKGDTVRFTDNSTGQLWVSAAPPASGERYPGTSTCGGTSALDSCGALQPGRYWEFTFTQTGAWQFVNSFDKSKSGTITVQ